MKNLLFIVVVMLMLVASPATTEAQVSLKFIEGVELNPDMAEYGILLPSTEPNKIIPVKKITTVTTNKGTVATEACKAIQFKYAQLLDSEVEGISNYALFDFIDEWWNTRYRYGGTTKKGVDCSAFSGLLLSTVYEIPLPRTAKQQYALCERITKKELKEGDLVFFNTRKGVSHVGVYLANNYFVHASLQGVTISSLDDAYYGRKYIGAGRVIVGGK